ncbi:MAG: hypothetical protein KDD61_15875, partial [Bdellovibrionales bacterium]|nr:hypothetical protein [Bdellovibrionales bacterium]
MTGFSKIISISFLLFTTACATNGKNKDTFNQDNFISTIEDHTQKSQKYSGFYNTFNARVTFLNSLVEEALLRKKQNYYQWSEDEFRKQREKIFQEQSTKSKIMLAFFTPERKDNNLDKPTSIWKVYL